MTRLRFGRVLSDVVDADLLRKIDERIDEDVLHDRPAKNQAERDSDLRLVEYAHGSCLYEADHNPDYLDCYRIQHVTKYVEPYETVDSQEASDVTGTYDPKNASEFLLLSNGVFLYETAGKPEDILRFLFGGKPPAHEYGMTIETPTLMRELAQKDEVTKLTLHNLEPKLQQAESAPSFDSITGILDQFAGIADNLTVSTGGAKDCDIRDARLVSMLLSRSEPTSISASYENSNSVEVSRSGWVESSFGEKTETKKRIQYMQNRFAPVIQNIPQ